MSRAITLNGVELKKVFDLNLDLDMRRLEVWVHYDHRFKKEDLTQLNELTTFEFKSVPQEEDIDRLVIYVPIDETHISMNHGLEDQLLKVKGLGKDV